MSSQNLLYVELASFTVGDTDDPVIKELTLPYDVLLEVLVAVELATSLPSSYTR